MQKATYETLMEFRAKCPEGQVTDDYRCLSEKPKSQKSKVRCKGGKGCVRGMQSVHDGRFHFVKFSRRQNVLCSCWK